MCKAVLRIPGGRDGWEGWVWSSHGSVMEGDAQLPNVAEQGELQRRAVHVRSVFLKVFQPHCPNIKFKTIHLPAAVSISYVHASPSVEVEKEQVGVIYTTEIWTTFSRILSSISRCAPAFPALSKEPTCSS